MPLHRGAFSTAQGVRLAYSTKTLIDESNLEVFAPPAIAKESVRLRIAETGIIPVLRTTSEEDALFAAEALVQSGIAILEISATFPGFLHVIGCVADQFPDILVGAGSLFDLKMARRCVDAGAKFLTSDGLVHEIVEFAAARDVVVFPGALTPTEIIEAWKAGVDFVRITPCDAMGGDAYIHSLKTLFPQVHFVASGGVVQNNALSFIKAGATAISVSKELLPAEAIYLRQSQRISELARRFLTSIDTARA
jgi:2-dehydro-3-deoxyphosphogluconate aldolase / (4S)-4-hydroxy-2-oxoglutarate aldolase